MIRISIQGALKELGKVTSMIKIMGSYKKALLPRNNIVIFFEAG